MAKKRNTSKKINTGRKGSGFSLAFLTPFLPKLITPEEPFWRYLPWLLGIGFILRATIALLGDFVIHPDEIMQYLEPAHGLVFGNSISYWEYYYGARSWIVPSVVATVLFLCKIIGLDTPLFYIAAVKLFFCALSVAVPFSLYVIGRRMFGEQSGRVVLVLSVFWYELIGFAHKPMTEFVATSILMLLALYTLRPQRLSLQQAVIATALAVFVVAVRFHYALAAGLIMLVPFVQSAPLTRIAMVAAAGAAFLLVGIFDYFTWGSFLHSYLLNFNVNLLLNAGRGEESSAWHFIGWLVVASGGIFLCAFFSMFNYQRRLFLLLLVAAILIPHMTQAHREYRFIFAALPFLLLLFADFLVIGWEQTKHSAKAALLSKWRSLLGLGYAVLISGVGINNALPYQSWVYKAHSQETGYVHFIHEQDEIFSIYRQLANDDTLRGVYDITRPYFNGGGYYYLHQTVPFYSLNTAIFPPANAKEYVSHIIAPPSITPNGLTNVQGNLAMQTEDGNLLALPRFVGDRTLNKLVFWSSNGEAIPVDGFTLAHESDKFAIWKVQEEDAPDTVRTWENYQIAPDSEAMFSLIERIYGNASKPAEKQFGIRFTEQTK